MLPYGTKCTIKHNLWEQVQMLDASLHHMLRMCMRLNYFTNRPMWQLQIATLTSGGGLHEMGKGSVRAVIASEGYVSDDEFRLHDMHVHDHVFITKKDEHVEEISMKQ